MDISLAGNIAKEAVKKAGKMLMEHYGHIAEVSFKGKSDIVTNVDKESEKIILGAIKNHFPGHMVLSEEAGLISGEEKYTWVIDPLDGTINYCYGSELFSIGICLLENKKPILSTIYRPIKDDLYFAIKGQGATLNGSRIQVSDRDQLKDSVVMFHLSSKKEHRKRTIDILDNIFKNSLHMRMFGGGLMSMAYIAEGKFNVFFNVKTNPWDILPGTLIIEEAGGKVTDINGKEIDYHSDSVLATNGKVHDEMLKLLKGA